MLVCWSLGGVGGTMTWSTWSAVNAWAWALPRLLRRTQLRCREQFL